MKKLAILVLLVSAILNGCLSENIPEVVNRQGNFEHLDNFDIFIHHVKEETADQLDYIVLDEEGDEIKNKLRFDGNTLTVSLHKGWKTIEEYQCESMKQVEGQQMVSIVLQQCSGDFNGDFELASFPLSSNDN